MTELSDYTLDKVGDSPPPPGPRPGRPRNTWAIAALLLAAFAAGVYLWLRDGMRDTSVEERAAAPTDAVSPNEPLGGDAEPVVLPLPADSDPLVRKMVAALSSHPLIARWLATNGLIRTFVVVVENISTGATPAKHLRVLRPAGPFRVLKASGEQRLDPRNYERYTGLADASAAIDPPGAARLYATLKPRIEEAYAELGRQEPFDRALERAIVVLLQTPVVDGPVRLEPTGATEYRYADPRLERLNAAQKQLLRMGPRNVRLIQDSLRGIARALGIPAERLP